MKWTFGIKHKLRAALVFACIFALLLGKNMLEKERVHELSDSFNTVYEDRLVVEKYIYQLSTLIYKNRLILDDCTRGEDADKALFAIGQNNREISSIVQAYSGTVLTSHEAEVFALLKSDLERMVALEDRLNQNPTSEGDMNLQARYAYHHIFDDASTHLNELSNIQIAIGKEIRDNSRQVVAGTDAWNRFEITLLIVFGLITQVLLFSARLSGRKPGVNFNLN
ncbi:MAG: MCP four helix bundle domain-containing protein [Cryomorphaceae bacterium]|nr:MCP four helix bundle domain-containing protein [Flavobacteriales bacterium]